MRPERTIILLKQFLGDGVMAEPLVSTLATTYAHVDVLALPTVQQVLGHLDGPTSFIQMEKIKSLRDTMIQARKIKLKGYDVAYLVNRSFRSAVLARLAKIPVRVGHGTEGRSFLLTKSVEYHASDFEAKSYADLAIAMGIDVRRIEPELRMNPEEQKEGKLLAEGAMVAIQPGARHDYKRTPTDKLAAVGNELLRRGYGLVFVGGPEEALAGEALAAALDKPVINLIGKARIRQTMSVLANMRAAVGSDTGVMHLAAGLGIPTITAFGPTPAIKWGHHYAPHQVLQAPNEDLAQLDPQVLIQAALRALGEA
ncbi:MAG TPA: glycosyltransferase family 9 protein [Fimbriimonadaceae bacterium]|nr:glycosyltransferase family 9 protein [Fimbriimonadaceae bacterium]